MTVLLTALIWLSALNVCLDVLVHALGGPPFTEPRWRHAIDSAALVWLSWYAREHWAIKS